MDFSKDDQLLNACKEGNLDLVRVLVGNGANIETTNDFGETPLILASSYGHFDIVKFLVGKGANIEATGYCGDTSLILASEHDYFKISEFLIESGANTETTNNHGKDFLYYIEDEGRKKELRELVRLYFGRNIKPVKK